MKTKRISPHTVFQILLPISLPILTCLLLLALDPLFPSFSSFPLFSKNLVYASSIPKNTDSLRREIQILNRTRHLAESEKKNHAPSTNSFTEIASYIDYLDSRIQNLCAKLAAAAGWQAVSDLDCPGPSSFLPGWQTPKARTTEEQVEELDRKLNEELGSFDELLAEEQKKIASTRHIPTDSKNEKNQEDYATTGLNSGPYEDIFDSDRETEEAKASSSASKNRIQTSNAHEKDQTQGKIPENAPAQDTPITNNKPKNTSSSTNTQASHGSRQDMDRAAPPPISKDDDIVARQLREAAEKETDPRLKKRLWEEYRRYKEGLR